MYRYATHVLEIDHLKRSGVAADHMRWAWPQEASRLREDALLAEIEQLKEAAAARETAVGEKVRSTQAALDAVLPELEESNRALAASVEEGAVRAEELGRNLYCCCPLHGYPCWLGPRPLVHSVQYCQHLI